MSEVNDTFRDKISTVNEKGKRIWIFPKKPKGNYFNARKVISYFLIVLLFSGPHIRINGQPFLLLNILERKFVILGKVFWPQDMYLFAILLIVGVVFVILFTIIFGRIFCGWVCPQTIFMEMLFRRIEYLIDGDWTEQRRLKDSKWTWTKIWKRSLKFSIFLIISFLIANTFLAYIIGSKELWKIQHDPIGEHLGGFIAISIFTFVFFSVYMWLREQVCTTICPYGRLQGVLLDKNTMVVAYDSKRGEPRSKIHKNEDRSSAGKGACIDCLQCVHVCPTGIDIRNGTQLECINCTACIDECNHMMEAVNQEKNLIRFVSENGIKAGTPFQWTLRVKAYSAVLLGLFIVFGALLITRKDFETNIIRQRGSTYSIDNKGIVSNIFEVDILNKTQEDYQISLKSTDPQVEIEVVGGHIFLESEAETKERIVVKVPNSLLKDGVKKLKIEVYGNGEKVDEVKTKFIGPLL